MQSFPLALCLAALFGLAACDVSAPPAETCTDASGAVYIKPSAGCPAPVVAAVPKPAVARKVVPKPAVVPVIEEPGGGDSGGGWG